MASDPGSGSAAAMLQQFLGTTSSGGRGDNLALIPMIVAMVAPPRAAGESGPPPPNHVMIINPVTAQAVMFEGDVTEFLMGGGNPGVPPASKAAIEGLRTVEAREVQEEESCPVCLDEYGLEMEVKEMPCKHRFHEGCIEKWLGMHGSCPMCRFEMQGEQEKVSASAMQVDEQERVAMLVEEERVVTMEAGRSSGWGRGSEGFDHTLTVSALIEVWERRAIESASAMQVEEERGATMEGFDHDTALGVEERRATDSSNGWERDHTRTISALIELWQRRVSGGH